MATTRENVAILKGAKSVSYTPGSTAVTKGRHFEIKQ